MSMCGVVWLREATLLLYFEKYRCVGLHTRIDADMRLRCIMSTSLYIYIFTCIT
jgi:hypothetical protein